MKNENLKIKLENLSKKSGVYKMLDKSGKVIYVGKAKNLKNRVSNYFAKSNQDEKTQLLQKNIDDFSIIITKTETQALLLENDLIKQFKPKYNILLKDSKSYPYIYISNDKHPRLGMFRGKKNKDYHYFGPYPSKYAARDALVLLKKIFKVRQCSNSFYRARSRPCLEYQIGLCSAPCVGKISDERYDQDVELVSLFLNGKSTKLLNQVSKKMKSASTDLDFEAAAKYRDQLISLRTIQEKHSSQFTSDMDVVSILKDAEVHCIEIVFVRSGKQIGNETFFPKNAKKDSCERVLSAFLPLYYLGKNTPKEIVISHKLGDKILLESGLSTKLIHKPKIDKKLFLETATLNAKENLKQRLLLKYTKKKQLEGIQKTLALDSLPEVMECFDISHTMGEATTASCVVFEKGLPKTSEYRQFNIKDITPGDDYAAINQAVFRRYSRLLDSKKEMPDIVFIDGGLGQLNQAIMVMNSIGIDSVLLVGVAKGEGRKAGLETLITVENDKVKRISLPPFDPALLLINHIRDESHRFAIKNHRKKRAKKRTQSSLESIKGVGVNKRSALLNHFGGIQEIENASLDELQKVVGINYKLATKILESLKK
ncbi:excinuclease ABC subunit UvrC [Candidatus Pseudothioglobus singularis]|uniref:UvrABC system protein C n=1 Tax=Candidatus Pseudothioglobus singularis PS1 TaxID=1125411 RepID=A0A0M4LPZ3_9GAMM|nr:excinuclease ABC subunit UvrC [Candidatus Pseudothioglobus singularis]ALE02047.1 excinuclease ABC subunit C [Candidatus Pseudothioglobus singularis PS1]